MAAKTVCVTGATGFIASSLIEQLLEKGYYVKATVRDPSNTKRVKHLLDLPNASTHLSLFKADLTTEGSFDEAVQGCTGVFHVATPSDHLNPQDHEKEVIKPTVDGVLNILKACVKAKTVKRVVYTSTAGAIAIQAQPPAVYDESCWTDIDLCYAVKMPLWSYYVAKTKAEKLAWQFAKENGIDLVATIPTGVFGPFLNPWKPQSVDMAISVITGNEALQRALYNGAAASHVHDVCSAHIFLFEHPQANGRYVISNHDFTIYDLAEALKQKYPEYNIPTKFEGVDESAKPIPFSPKKLLDLGFKFKYDTEKYNIGDICAEAVECCKQKGLL